MLLAVLRAIDPRPIDATSSSRALPRRLMSLYNRKGIFHNTGDTLEGLQDALRRRFPHFDVDVVGCAALFSAGA
jgi:hypothetical protein